VVVTRLGDAPLAAHQIAFQLWIFIALVLDAIAIAGQIIVGQELGASRPDAAYDASVRMIWLSIIVGAAFSVVLLALSGVIPGSTSIRGAGAVRVAVAAIRAVAAAHGIALAIDGILIGASDGRYLALPTAAFAVLVAWPSSSGPTGCAWRLGRTRSSCRHADDADARASSGGAGS
jgi:Na+-driven multidrug efflux pump